VSERTRETCGHRDGANTSSCARISCVVRSGWAREENGVISVSGRQGKIRAQTKRTVKQKKDLGSEVLCRSEGGERLVLKKKGGLGVTARKTEV